MMQHALVIGCGNIGGMYDIASDGIFSHAKALYHTGAYKLYFYDTDFSLAETLAHKYSGTPLFSLDNTDIEFDWISIAVPTGFHYEYYEKFAGKTSCILLEKPISYLESECEKIKWLKEKTGQLTYVNYIREFLPAYNRLKLEITSIEQEGLFDEIIVKYQRGVINNGSHALSLLSFLFNDIVQIEEPQIRLVEHYTEADSTVSVSFKNKRRAFTFNGLKEKGYPFFEIELFSKNHYISIADSGNKISVLRKKTAGVAGIKLDEQLVLNNCLNDYMLEVVKAITEKKSEGLQEDNFETACIINKELIKLCQNLR